jgi:hypothetical protein
LYFKRGEGPPETKKRRPDSGTTHIAKVDEVDAEDAVEAAQGDGFVVAVLEPRILPVKRCTAVKEW